MCRGSVGDVFAQLARVFGGIKTPKQVSIKTPKHVIELFERLELKPIDLANSLNREIADILEDDPFYDPRGDYFPYIPYLSEHGIGYDPDKKRFEAGYSP